MQTSPPSFRRLLLRELPVLAPAAVIFAIVRGAALSDWLISIALVAGVGLFMAWLAYQRELIKRRPMPRKAARASPSKAPKKRRR